MKPCQAHHRHFRTGLSRREFLQAMGVVAAGAVLAGCKSPAAEAGTPIVDAANAKATVAIAKAETYDRALVKKQVQAMFDGIGGISDVLAHGTRVGVKVNLTGGVRSGALPGVSEIESFVTHPEVVRAVCELLRDAGAKEIFIVEAVYEKESWPHYGYTPIAEELGATLIDLNDPDPYPDFAQTSTGTNPFIYDKLTFNPLLNELDAFVSISKMKCHNTCGVTHTIKNLMGLTPYKLYELNKGDRSRTAIHGKASETRKRLPAVLMDLNQARPIHLSVIDGIMTTEGGEGPWIPAMTSIKPGVLFAGKDRVATDSVATAAMGFDPAGEYPDAPYLHAENHLIKAAALGMGTNKLSEIKIVGPTIAEVTKKFAPSY